MTYNLIRSEMDNIVNELRGMQSKDGSWRLCFESGPMTDAYMIILMRSLELHEEPLIRILADRIVSKQEDNGAWKLFYDEIDGNLEATTEAYYALLFSGFYSKDEPRMQKAKQFILQKGGLSQVKTMLTQVILAATGQSSWPNSIKIPIEALLVPHWFFIHLFDLSGHARVHLVPIMIMANQNSAYRTEKTPDLSELFIADKKFNSDSSWIASLHYLLGAVPFLHNPIHASSLRKAESFMLERIEADGTLLSYSTATILMIFALLSLGYSKSSPIISNALRGVQSMLCEAQGNHHLQISTSTVWDTAMLSYALQQAGVPISDPMIQKAGQYLISRQHIKYGDWSLRNPNTPPGGWGFSDTNTLYPDVDDSTAALRALKPLSSTHPTYSLNWQGGLKWVLSMRNADGGWPAFEKSSNKRLLALIQFESARDIVIDPSTADLTGRTLQFLGNNVGLSTTHNLIKKPVNWLLAEQEENGSWYGRWGICYIHGTSAAVTGMIAVGVPKHHHSIQKAIRWITHIQNRDGGWGESCYSDMEKKYVPLDSSTPSQTAWALDALIDTYDKPNSQIQRGILHLLQSLQLKDWPFVYPTGAGLPGSIYVHYQSNNYIWPLLTFAKYLRKYA